MPSISAFLIPFPSPILYRSVQGVTLAFELQDERQHISRPAATFLETIGKINYAGPVAKSRECLLQKN